MPRGRINLYSRGDEFIATAVYDCRKKRSEIISTWASCYGKRFNQCYFIVVPELFTTSIKKDGTNSNNKIDFDLDFLIEEAIPLILEP